MIDDDAETVDAESDLEVEDEEEEQDRTNEEEADDSESEVEEESGDDLDLDDLETAAEDTAKALNKLSKLLIFYYFVREFNRVDIQIL